MARKCRFFTTLFFIQNRKNEKNEEIVQNINLPLQPGNCECWLAHCDQLVAAGGSSPTKPTYPITYHRSPPSLTHHQPPHTSPLPYPTKTLPCQLTTKLHQPQAHLPYLSSLPYHLTPPLDPTYPGLPCTSLYLLCLLIVFHTACF